MGALPAGLLSNKFSRFATGDVQINQEPAATLRVEGSVNMIPFEVGKSLWSNTDRYQWKSVPPSFKNYHYTQFDSHHKGLTEFTVESTGLVYLAVTSRWAGGGNGSGNWAQELISKEAFASQGWKEITPLHETADDIGHEHRWVLYSRQCQSGEQFRIRTEKYCAPILFLPQR